FNDTAHTLTYTLSLHDALPIWSEFLELTNNISEAEEIIDDGSDAEMVDMAKLQLDEAETRLPELEEEIKFLLIPKDPEDSKNARSEEHTSELQSRENLVCRLLL